LRGARENAVLQWNAAIWVGDEMEPAFGFEVLTCGLGKAGAGRMKSEGKWLSEMECKGGFCRGVLQGLFLEWLKYFINFSYAIIAATVLSWSVEN